MTWLLAFAGFAALIVLHEAGHFAAAKAVGMRVERFSLFFGKPLVSVRRGETEYGIGPIPLGGYVKITGMNPREELPPGVDERAYWRQPVWKRIVVISAGPAVNVALAFLILWGLLMVDGQVVSSTRVDSTGLVAPAARFLQPGDRILSVDGSSNDPLAIARKVARHRCAGRPTGGCEATTAAHVVVRRDGRRIAFDIRPRFLTDPAPAHMRLGVQFAPESNAVGPLRAASLSGTTMWDVTTATTSRIAKLFDAKERKQLSGTVGAYEVTRESFGFSVSQALAVLALISLSLAIINLFPFLPLDGGHIFWALAEKVRGRAIPISVMEGASVIGFALVIMLFLVGLTNDIDRLQHGGFNVR